MNNQHSLTGYEQKDIRLSNQTRANILASGSVLKSYLANDTTEVIIVNNEGNKFALNPSKIANSLNSNTSVVCAAGGITLDGTTTVTSLVSGMVIAMNGKLGVTAIGSGPQGATGLPGSNGTPGAQGATGLSGSNGTPGAQGNTGVPGLQGATGVGGGGSGSGSVSGTVNYVAKFTDSTIVGNSNIYINPLNFNVGIGVTTDTSGILHLVSKDTTAASQQIATNVGPQSSADYTRGGTVYTRKDCGVLNDNGSLNIIFNDATALGTGYVWAAERASVPINQANFTFDSAGVTIYNGQGSVSPLDTAGNLCIFTSSNNLTLKNRLGYKVNVGYIIDYFENDYFGWLYD